MNKKFKPSRHDIEEMENYLDDFILYKNFSSMPNEGGTDNQPYEWMEAMFSIQLAFNRVEAEEDERERKQAEAEQQKSKSGGGSSKQRFVG